MTDLTHLDDDGAAHMVDVGDKDETRRIATAEGYLLAQPNTIAALISADLPKGEALGTARLAGIMGAKKTADLIPLCHPLPITGVDIDISRVDDHRLRVVASVKVDGKTGVEMEALTAVSVALLTLYDMGKALDKSMRFETVRLLSKSGGRSGDFVAPPLENQ